MHEARHSVEFINTVGTLGDHRTLRLIIATVDRKLGVFYYMLSRHPFAGIVVHG